MQVDGNSAAGVWTLSFTSGLFFLTEPGALLPSNPRFALTRPFFSFFWRPCESDLQYVHINCRLSLAFQMFFETCQLSRSVFAMAEYISMRYKMMVEVVWVHICLHKSWHMSRWCLFHRSGHSSEKWCCCAFWPRCLPLAGTAKEHISYYPFSASATAICQVAVELRLTPAERPFNLGGVCEPVTSYHLLCVCVSEWF